MVSGISKTMHCGMPDCLGTCNFYNVCISLTKYLKFAHTFLPFVSTAVLLVLFSANLAALHTVALVKHNQFARELATINPHWDDERIFQVSYVTAELNVANKFIMIYK